jgi:hypothetical protein
MREWAKEPLWLITRVQVAIAYDALNIDHGVDLTTLTAKPLV